MCAVSAVYDHHAPLFPQLVETGSPFDKWSSVVQSYDLPAAIEQFKTDLEKAKAQDLADGAPDCFDPEKQKLEDRVAELERMLANPPEFVIVTGGNVEPGTYRVIDGKLYKEL